MPNNGLVSFSLHQHDDPFDEIRSINLAVAETNFAVKNKKDLNPEAVALKYLENALSQQTGAMEEFTALTSTDRTNVQFRPITTEYIPFTENKLVKFRQSVNNLDVYGSVANIEMDRDNNFVSVNSSLVRELDPNGPATISPAQARNIASQYFKRDLPESINPSLCFYFFGEVWKLVYMLREVEVLPDVNEAQPLDTDHEPPVLMNIVIDAREGKVLLAVPAMINFRSQETANDESGLPRTFFVSDDGIQKIMLDDTLNVSTHDNNFNTYFGPTIPGQIISPVGTTWSPAGVSAHANASEVVSFLRNILKRNSVDGAGLRIISSINCVRIINNQEWKNAAWLPDKRQMVYGQILLAGKLKSLAVALDIVAHEIFHGVTQFTANLDYHNQSGALNESYSDIFGIIIANYKEDTSRWVWDLGGQINNTPFRNLKDPTLHNQPAHMNDYKNLSDDQPGDWGGVHINSGIHNKTLFLLIDARDHSGKAVFTPLQIARLYYMGLLQLKETSLFIDSYRAIKNSATSLFSVDLTQAEKLKAIDSAFKTVGII